MPQSAFKDSIRSILDAKGRDVWTISPESTVYDALALMKEHDVGALVVTSENAPVGMISERDYARKLVLHGRTSRQTEVREVMSTPLITVTPDHTVEECLRLMTENRVRHLPVLEHGKLAGVVSIGDLVNAIISAQDQTIQQLKSYIAGKYPG